MSLHCMLKRILNHFSRQQKQTTFVVIGAVTEASSSMGAFAGAPCSGAYPS